MAGLSMTEFIDFDLDTIRLEVPGGKIPPGKTITTTVTFKSPDEEWPDDDELLTAIYIDWLLRQLGDD
jgi:hypothetical protein